MHKIFWRERAHLKAAIQKFFASHNYIEIDSPIMVNVPGTEAHLHYFSSDWDFHAQHQTRYLRSSPELSLKEILSPELPRIYEIARCFRNGMELGDWHNPEFTMLEYYQTGISFSDFIRLTQDFFEETSYRLSKVGVRFDYKKLKKQWRLLTVAEAFKEFAGILLVDGDMNLAAKARSLNYISVNESDDFETAYFKILIDKVEPELKKLGAVVLYDFPPSQAALARVENGWAKRFEVYIHGVELCNAFEELTGYPENLQRLRATEAFRKKMSKPSPLATDDDVRRWSAKLPPSCGNAIGFDRWLAILMNQDSLDRCLMRNFPSR